MATIAIQKAIQNANYYQNSMTRPFHQRIIRPGDQMYRFTTTIEHLDKKAGAARSIYGSKGHTPARDYVTQTLIQAKYQLGISTGHNNSRLHATTHPDTEGLLTPCASPKKYWTMNSHKASNL